MSQNIFKGIKFPGMDDVFIAPNYNNMPYTTIRKIKKDKRNDIPKRIFINCHNLIPGRTYTIRLYTKQRSRGLSNKEWHCANEYNYPAQKMGYYAYTLHNKSSDDEVIPAWMPNNGTLRTEWTFTATDTTYGFDLQVENWILDLFKPSTFKPGLWNLIGIGQKAQDRASRLFQFRIYDTVEDYEGESRNTLRIGEASYNEAEEKSHIQYLSVI